MIENLKKDIDKKLNSQIINSKILLNKIRLIDDNSKKSSQYQDPNYLPFFYYLSKFVKPKNLLHVGFNLALQSCCFLQGSETVNKVVGFQRKDSNFYSPRLAISNLKDVKRKINIDFYYGNIIDLQFTQKLSDKFDLIIITENANEDITKESLDVCWNYLNLDGFLILDYLKGNYNLNLLFENFCKSKNKDYIVFKTRYETGLVQK